jgi:hypothetical protein
VLAVIQLQRIVPFALLVALAGCADMRVTKTDLQRNSYEITPPVSWVRFRGSDEQLKDNIKEASAGLCGPGGVEILDVERPAYILVPMTPRGYLHCR